MTRGFIASLLLHLGLIAWAVFGTGISPPRITNTAEAVEVSMISKADLETKQKQGDVSSKIEDSAATSKPSPIVADKEVPKPKAAEPAAPPPPPPAAEPEPPKPVETAVVPPPPPPPAVKPAEPPPPAEPKTDEIAIALAAEEEARRKAEADAAAAKAKADAAAAAAKAKADAAAKAKAIALAKAKADAAKAKAKAEADAKAKKPTLDDVVGKALAGSADVPKPELLDKDPTKKVGGGAAPSAVPTKTAARGPTAGSPTGRDSVNTANEEALLRSMISQALKPCWRLPTAGGDSRSIPTVKLVWKMRPNGTVDGDPRVLQKENSPIGSLAADAAVRAVTTCAFAGLPTDKYALWREIEWDFDPRRAP